MSRRRYTCPEAERLSRRAYRLMAWARQASERGAFARADRLNALASADICRSHEIEAAWILARRAA